jgi:hypothetical protein
MSKKSIFSIIFALFVAVSLFSGCNGVQNTELNDGKEVVSIIWKGAFSSSDEIENPEYLWAYYNTEDGCSYIYDGEKWVLLAGKKEDSAGSSDNPKVEITIDPTEVFVVTYQTEFETTPQQFYCMKGFKLTEEKLPQLVKEHYNFHGWYDGEVLVTKDYQIQKNTTLIAKWSKEKFKITYVCDNLTPPESIIVDYGTVLDESYLPDLDNEQYSFYRWKENGVIVQSGYVVDHNVVFTGSAFDKSKPYTITLINSASNAKIFDVQILANQTLLEAQDFDSKDDFVISILGHYGLAFMDMYGDIHIDNTIDISDDPFFVKQNDEILDINDYRFTQNTELIIEWKTENFTVPGWGGIICGNNTASEYYMFIYKTGQTDTPGQQNIYSPQFIIYNCNNNSFFYEYCMYEGKGSYDSSMPVDDIYCCNLDYISLSSGDYKIFAVLNRFYLLPRLGIEQNDLPIIFLDTENLSSDEYLDYCYQFTVE